MSKALLILDEMPESCWECPCFRNDNVDGVHYYQCNITLRSKETTVECRMKDCPLLTEGEIYEIDYSRWIPVSERLPEERINPITEDFYEYQCTYHAYGIYDVRSYKFGDGHWWHGPGIMDDSVIAWRPLPEPYKIEGEGKG